MFRLLHSLLQVLTCVSIDRWIISDTYGDRMDVSSDAIVSGLGTLVVAAFGNEVTHCRKSDNHIQISKSVTFMVKTTTVSDRLRSPNFRS